MKVYVLILIDYISGRNWIRQMILGTCLFPFLLMGVALGVNFIAMIYHASRAFPLSSMVSGCGLLLIV